MPAGGGLGLLLLKLRQPARLTAARINRTVWRIGSSFGHEAASLRSTPELVPHRVRYAMEKTSWAESAATASHLVCQGMANALTGMLPCAMGSWLFYW